MIVIDRNGDLVGVGGANRLQLLVNEEELVGLGLLAVDLPAVKGGVL